MMSLWASVISALRIASGDADRKRLENLKIQLAIVIPFGRPDKNGIVYSKEAVEKAVHAFEGQLPIVYRGNGVDSEETVIGVSMSDTCSMLWDDECQVCEVIMDGSVHYGSTECVVNEIKDGVVTDFSIVSVGLSR